MALSKKAQALYLAALAKRKPVAKVSEKEQGAVELKLHQLRIIEWDKSKGYYPN